MKYFFLLYYKVIKIYKFVLSIFTMSSNTQVNQYIEQILAQNQRLIQMLESGISESIKEEEMNISLEEENSSFDQEMDCYFENESVISIETPLSLGESSNSMDISSDESNYDSDDTFCIEVRKKIPKKTVRNLMKFGVGGKSSYSPNEVKEMDDFTLTREFIRITGYERLNCKHCKHGTALDNWIVSIRKRCLKKEGLSVKMKIPKTCDQQQAVNMMRNPVNNKVYPIMRASTIYWEDETTKAAAMNRKGVLFNEIGVDVRPYKYKMYY